MRDLEFLEPAMDSPAVADGGELGASECGLSSSG